MKSNGDIETAASLKKLLDTLKEELARENDTAEHLGNGVGSLADEFGYDLYENVDDFTLSEQVETTKSANNRRCVMAFSTSRISKYPEITCQQHYDYLSGDLQIDQEYKAGCYCNIGYIRDGITGRCIEMQECREMMLVSPITTSTATPVCRENEVFRKAAVPENSCNKPFIRSYERTGYERKCFCKGGFIRRNFDGRCVQRKYCKHRPAAKVPQQSQRPQRINSGYMTRSGQRNLQGQQRKPTQRPTTPEEHISPTFLYASSLGTSTSFSSSDTRKPKAPVSVRNLNPMRVASTIPKYGSTQRDEDVESCPQGELKKSGFWPEKNCYSTVAEMLQRKFSFPLKCFCKPGFVRSTSNFGSRCIKRSDCDSVNQQEVMNPAETRHSHDFIERVEDSNSEDDNLFNELVKLDNEISGSLDNLDWEQNNSKSPEEPQPEQNTLDEEKVLSLASDLDFSSLYSGTHDIQVQSHGHKEDQYDSDKSLTSLDTLSQMDESDNDEFSSYDVEVMFYDDKVEDYDEPQISPFNQDTYNQLTEERPTSKPYHWMDTETSASTKVEDSSVWETTTLKVITKPDEEAATDAPILESAQSTTKKPRWKINKEKREQRELLAKQNSVSWGMSNEEEQTTETSTKSNKWVPGPQKQKKIDAWKNRLQDKKKETENPKIHENEKDKDQEKLPNAIKPSSPREIGIPKPNTDANFKVYPKQDVISESKPEQHIEMAQINSFLPAPTDASTTIESITEPLIDDMYMKEYIQRPVQQEDGVIFRPVLLESEPEGTLPNPDYPGMSHVSNGQKEQMIVQPHFQSQALPIVMPVQQQAVYHQPQVQVMAASVPQVIQQPIMHQPIIQTVAPAQQQVMLIQNQPVHSQIQTTMNLEPQPERTISKSEIPGYPEYKPDFTNEEVSDLINAQGPDSNPEQPISLEELQSLEYIKNKPDSEKIADVVREEGKKHYVSFNEMMGIPEDSMGSQSSMEPLDTGIQGLPNTYHSELPNFNQENHYSNPQSGPGNVPQLPPINENTYGFRPNNLEANHPMGMTAPVQPIINLPHPDQLLPDGFSENDEISEFNNGNEPILEGEQNNSSNNENTIIESENDKSDLPHISDAFEINPDFVESDEITNMEVSDTADSMIIEPKPEETWMSDEWEKEQANLASLFAKYETIDKGEFDFDPIKEFGSLDQETVEPIIDAANTIDQAGLVAEWTISESLIDKPALDDPILAGLISDEPGIDEPKAENPLIDEPIVGEQIVDGSLIDELSDETIQGSIAEPLILESVTDDEQIDDVPAESKDEITEEFMESDESQNIQDIEIDEEVWTPEEESLLEVDQVMDPTLDEQINQDMIEEFDEPEADNQSSQAVEPEDLNISSEDENDFVTLDELLDSDYYNSEEYIEDLESNEENVQSSILGRSSLLATSNNTATDEFTDLLDDYGLAGLSGIDYEELYGMSEEELENSINNLEQMVHEDDQGEEGTYDQTPQVMYFDPENAAENKFKSDIEYEYENYLSEYQLKDYYLNDVEDEEYEVDYEDDHGVEEKPSEEYNYSDTDEFNVSEDHPDAGELLYYSDLYSSDDYLDEYAEVDENQEHEPAAEPVQVSSNIGDITETDSSALQSSSHKKVEVDRITLPNGRVIVKSKIPKGAAKHHKPINKPSNWPNLDKHADESTEFLAWEGESKPHEVHSMDSGHGSDYEELTAEENEMMNMLDEMDLDDPFVSSNDNQHDTISLPSNHHAVQHPALHQPKMESPHQANSHLQTSYGQVNNPYGHPQMPSYNNPYYNHYGQMNHHANYNPYGYSNMPPMYPHIPLHMPMMHMSNYNNYYNQVKDSRAQHQGHSYGGHGYGYKK